MFLGVELGFLSEGDVFSGDVEEGKREGQGHYVYANGDRYNGLWKAGRHIEGVMRYDETGEMFDGSWEDDRPTTGTWTKCSKTGMPVGYRGEGTVCLSDLIHSLCVVCRCCIGASGGW